VSFDLQAGETLGVVGESGCGKSTLARALLNLVPFRAESLRWFDQEMAPMSGVGANAGFTASASPSTAAWLQVRRQVQMVFQDPLASLDPRMNILQILSEPLRTHEPSLTASDRLDRVCALIERVGLDRHQLDRYPHEFSGGQCQRIGIARALILRPRVIICDEPVSALDVSIQAQIINLLRDLQQEFGLALIFIAHDLTVIRHVSQRVLVMYLGQVVEIGARAALFDNPRHPYTRALLASVPVPDPRIERHRASTALVGELPSPLDPPSGCAFRTRCPIAQDRCAQSNPVLAFKGGSEGSGQTQAACWLA
jgi:oligopeptide transport system ATP-binding protein